MLVMKGREDCICVVICVLLHCKDMKFYTWAWNIHVPNAQNRVRMVKFKRTYSPNPGL
jgi:hypothetical protein